MKTRLFAILLAGLAFINVATNALARSEEKEKAEKKLASGAWLPCFELGQNIYPAMVISSATLKTPEPDEKSQRLGDPWGCIGIAVKSPADNFLLELELSGGKYVRPSKMECQLPRKDQLYWVFPTLKYDYEQLLRVRQTIPEDIVFKVKGLKPMEQTVRVQVHPVNVCVYAYIDVEGEYRDVGEFFAAYVNENHPEIDKILQRALKSGRVDSFAGYQGDADEVRAEIKAIWDTLAERRIRYSSITTTSGNEDEDCACQHIRLLGESLKATQANCADGSVLLASILRKIGLDVVLIILPNHMFVGVSLDDEGQEFIFLETTLMGSGTFSEAIAEGHEQYEKNKEKFESEKQEDWDYQLVNIAEAREIGIMPIKDSVAE